MLGSCARASQSAARRECGPGHEKADAFDSKEPTNGERFAGIAVVRRTASLKHKEKGPARAPRGAGGRPVLGSPGLSSKMFKFLL